MVLVGNGCYGNRFVNVDSWNDVLLIEKDRSMLAFLYPILIRSVFYQTVTGVQEDKTFLPVEHVYKGRLNIVSSRPEYEKKPDLMLTEVPEVLRLKKNANVSPT